MNFDKININIPELNDYSLPDFMEIEQLFENTEINDAVSALNDKLRKFAFPDLMGKKVAITAGSRGIAQITVILRTLVYFLKNECQAIPFIVPAMGSHGGATSTGQKEYLAGYGITEETVGCPIISSMETVEIGKLASGVPVFCDKNAYMADAIIVCNKIKPHTDFKADIESGMCKMMAIGLGKQKGAAALHREGFENFHDIIPQSAKVFINTGKILCGLAIQENAYDQLMNLSLIEPCNIIEEEKKLLSNVKRTMARLLMNDIDLLIVDKIGKNISGEGLDPNVTGRPGSGIKEGFQAPRITRIIALDLTDETHGNAAGIGLADFTTKRTVSKIQFSVTYTNAITAGLPKVGRIPIFFESDREGILVALHTCPKVVPEQARIVRIRDTLSLSNILVSAAFIDEVKNNPSFRISGKLKQLTFDEKGNLF